MSEQTEHESRGEILENQSDRFDDLFANEGSPSGTPEGEERVEAEEDYDGADGRDDEPFLADDPDYDPDKLDDPDDVTEPETEEEAAEAPETPVETTEANEEAATPNEFDEAPVVDAAADKAAFMAEVMEQFKEANLDPNQGKAFAKVKYEAREAKQALADLQANAINTPEMQDIAAKAARVSEVEVALKAAQDQLALFDFQTTPEYKREIEAPYHAIYRETQNIETTASIPEGAIMKAISVGDRATQDANIQNLLDSYNINARDQNTIYNKANDMLNLTARDASLRETAQERLGESRAQQEARDAYMVEQQKSVYRESVQNTFKDYEGQIEAFLNPDGSNNDAWDDAIKNSEGLDFSGDAEIQGLGAFALSAVPHLMEQNTAMASEIAKYKALASRTKAVAPPSPSRTASAASPKVSATSRNMSMSDSLGAKLRAAGQ